MIVVLGGIAGIFSPISWVCKAARRGVTDVSSNIFVPAIPTLAAAFNRSEEDISLAVTVYLVFQAITPSFLGSMSDSFGRRPTYIATLSLYLGANIGLACMPTTNYGLLLFLRILQVCGNSCAGVWATGWRDE
jgi:MFS family permease